MLTGRAVGFKWAGWMRLAIGPKCGLGCWTGRYLAVLRFEPRDCGGADLLQGKARQGKATQGKAVLCAVEKTATSALRQALKDEAAVKLLGADPVVGGESAMQKAPQSGAFQIRLEQSDQATVAGRAALAWAAMALNASGSRTARSARTLRSTMMPALFRPSIRRE